MKEKDIDYINKTICKFIQDISICQDDMIEEAPVMWKAMLMSLSTLSNVSMALENAKGQESQEELDLYNQFLEANGLPKRDRLPDKFYKDTANRNVVLEREKSGTRN